MKCPHCQEYLSVVVTATNKVNVSEREVEAVAYGCSHCHKVISVGPNPISMRNWILDEIVHELKKRIRP